MNEEEKVKKIFLYSFSLLYLVIAIFLFIYVFKNDLRVLFYFLILVFVNIFIYKVMGRKPRFKLKDEGTFEGRYKNLIVRQKILIMKILGEEKLIGLQSNPILGEEFFKELLLQTKNNEDRFLALLGVGRALWEFSNIDEAINYLKQAKNIKPHDLIVNIELAWACEAKDAAKEAISSYEEALQDPTITPSITEFINSEIERVKTNGPRTIPPLSGLRLLVG